MLKVHIWLFFIIIFLAVICSNHFKTSDYRDKPDYLKNVGYSPKNVRDLKIDAIPTENLHIDNRSPLQNITNVLNTQDKKENLYSSKVR